MRVADTFLPGNRIAFDNRVAIVQRREAITVVADGHVQTVGLVFVEHHQVGTHLFLLRNGIAIAEMAKRGTPLSG